MGGLIMPSVLSTHPEESVQPLISSDTFNQPVFQDRHAEPDHSNPYNQFVSPETRPDLFLPQQSVARSQPMPQQSQPYSQPFPTRAAMPDSSAEGSGTVEGRLEPGVQQNQSQPHYA